MSTARSILENFVTGIVTEEGLLRPFSGGRHWGDVESVRKSLIEIIQFSLRVFEAEFPPRNDNPFDPFDPRNSWWATGFLNDTSTLTAEQYRTIFDAGKTSYIKAIEENVKDPSD